MKKIFTLLFVVGLFTAASAQPGMRKGRGTVGVTVVATTAPFGHPVNSFAADRRLREELAMINLKYDRKIYQVRNSLFTGRAAKARKIHKLELQRQREISNLYRHYAKKSIRHGESQRRY